MGQQDSLEEKGTRHEDKEFAEAERGSQLLQAIFWPHMSHKTFRKEGGTK